MRTAIGLGLALAAATPAAAQTPELKLWRLDCGSIAVSDFDVFSDTYLYPGKPKQLTASCYLVKHGDRYLLWDTGVAGPAKEWVFTIGLKERITDQLKRIGVEPERVNFVGISHYHDDHTGQAADFPKATLLMGSGDWEAVKARPETAARFKPWIEGGAKVDPVSRDKDVFGDRSVTILDMPGHTPGHKALLVRLKSGPVLLSGDLYHATEQVANRGVPIFNTNRADTLASFDRFQAIASNIGAKVIIQHEADDIAKLPAFPEAAR
ncbi:N-acyl homoserine lactonase family protein [Sphingomonas xanthus]|uniref:N-acyl homoserine lactonase family protein n=1 Tax=Sphingomonas xanthus TaxID=2594473 RepID=A0A516IPW2_9SPHN|nr:N-acyl homoserine lactonase family protein [Sphingomonas xanthus]QDP18958.1 N-acyl homoserine lactonase family protein [Sphingomonas xanthus]